MEFHTKIILHPTDFSDNAAKALHFATSQLEIPRTRLVVIHVVELPDKAKNSSVDEWNEITAEKSNQAAEKMEQYLRNYFGTNEPVPVPERVIRLHETPYKDILDYINKIEPYMVVVGRKGETKLPNSLMGGNTKHLLEKSTCPVTVCPSTKHESEPS